MAIATSDILAMQNADLARRAEKRAKRQNGRGSRPVRRTVNVVGSAQIRDEVETLRMRLAGVRGLQGGERMQAALRLRRDARGVSDPEARRIARLADQLTREQVLVVSS